MTEMLNKKNDLPRRTFIGGSRALLYGGMALLVLLVSFAAALMLLHMHRETKAKAITNMQNLAKSINLSVSGLIETVDVALLGAAREVEQELAEGRADPENINGRLLDYGKYISSPVSLRVTDEAGDIVYGAGFALQHVNIADRGHFASHRDGPDRGLLVSDPLFSRVEKQWVWIFSRRINRPDGKFAGVLYAVFPLQTVHDIFTRFSLDQGNTIALRTLDLKVIARYPESSAAHYPIGANRAPDLYVAAIRDNPHEGSYIDEPNPIDGIRHIHSYSGNLKYGYYVNVGMTREAAFAEWRKQMLIVGALLTAFLVTLIWLAGSIMRGWKRQEQFVGTLMEQDAKLQQMAHFDAITGLPNRVLLSDRLHQAMSQAKRQGRSLAVAYLDIDRFKAVNDENGHGAGDEVLRLVAQRMKDSIREGDTLARIGGDEFVAVLVGLERPDEGHPALLRLLNAVAMPINLDDAVIRTSASIGVTVFPSDPADADQLLRHADLAMYQAKEAGGNRYHLFDVEQAATNKVQSENLTRIGQALEQEEFVLYFQPKVNMRTGSLLGVEALIRWRHPESGLLPPGAFMPLIADHPLDIEVGEWVVRAALTQMSLWRASGLDISVSVNISGRQLLQADFVQRLTESLAAHPAVPPGLLEIEILETSAFDNIERVSQVMRECKRLGVRFSLDDFGTGFSSLSFLKRLPADMVKIDRSFIGGMLENRDDMALVEGVIRLASAFGLDVIAEGIETAEHERRLLSMGCEFGQGYAIGRPMPAKDLPGWLAMREPGAAAAAVRSADSQGAGHNNGMNDG